MSISLLDHTIHSILNPEFQCKLNVDLRNDGVLCGHINFTTKKITQRVKGGKDACLLQIGERIHQLYIENTSILILDPSDNILCNQQFRVEVFKVKEVVPNFFSDLAFSFYQEKGSRIFFYSIWIKNQDKKVTGCAETSPKEPYLAQQKGKDILWICSELIKARVMGSGQKQLTNVQARIHEVDFTEGMWRIYNH